MRKTYNYGYGIKYGYILCLLYCWQTAITKMMQQFAQILYCRYHQILHLHLDDTSPSGAFKAMIVRGIGK